MARSIWTGALSFGLVNVPVKLFTAVEDKDVHFHQFQRDTGARVHNKRVAEGSGEEVPFDDIVKGYEVRDGEYVMVTPDELESVEPERSRTIDLEDFVDLDEVDPIYFQKTYFLAPADKTAAKPFALLLAALRDTNRAGIARFVMRGKEYLAAVRPGDGVMLLETMHFPDEVRDPADLDEVEAVGRAGKVKPKERKMAEQLIESLATGWDPGRYRDSHRERVLELIAAKDKGEELVYEEPEERPAVTDLMAALEASVRDARGGRGRAGGRGPTAADASREELYAEAQRRRIPGRSKMSKDQLAAALAEGVRR